MSTRRTRLLRAAATFGIAAGIVAAAAGTAHAQTHIVATADIGIPSDIAPGANTLVVSLTPTGDDTVQNPNVALTPDDAAVLDFNPGQDARCTDDGTSRLECAIAGPLPSEGAVFEIEVVVSEDVNEESDLGFGLVFQADDVESASAHTALVLGSTALDPADEAPGDTDDGEELPVGEEPVDTPSEEGDETESDAESDTAADEAQEQLPKTGADSGLLIGAAGAAAVVGFGVLVLARRRKAAKSWS